MQTKKIKKKHIFWQIENTAIYIQYIDRSSQVHTHENLLEFMVTGWKVQYINIYIYTCVYNIQFIIGWKFVVLE